ncbi:MAG TPA: sugar ABC transporter substrate-binding protein [Reyranella sp.]|nr:sugar ABC transporter substrate-binding protein [Reyranella sp.]
MVVTLAVFTKNNVNPAYTAARLAADRVAAEAGARTVHYVPEAPDDVGQQKALAAQALAARPDAVLLNPADDVKLAENVERFTAAGIPTVTFINRLPGQGIAFVGSDDRAIGRSTATALCRKLGRGKIVGLEGLAAVPTSRARVEGLREAVAAHPGIELLGLGVGEMMQAPGKRAMAALLARHEKIDGVWAANDLMALGALEALGDAGGTAIVTGINGLPAAIDCIERGTMLASADFSAFNIAAIATRAALRHLAGQPVPREIMVPAELIDRANCARWKVPFEQRPCPAWDEIVRK